MNGTRRQQCGFLRKWLRTRRGAIVVLVALMMIVFLASVAFSVDVAYMQLTKIKLRSAADAAARAAGEGLSRAKMKHTLVRPRKTSPPPTWSPASRCYWTTPTSSSANPASRRTVPGPLHRTASRSTRSASMAAAPARPRPAAYRYSSAASSTCSTSNPSKRPPSSGSTATSASSSIVRAR